MNKLGNPVPIFLDARGALIDGGKVYVGVANADPEVAPIVTYWDAALTVPAAQPLRTVAGVIVNGGQPGQVFVAEADYSMRLRDNGDSQVFYSPSIYANTDAFQPVDADLTAIAALSTTPFGRNLLTLADQAALVTATGLAASLPLTGGTLTGPVTRQGAGVYAYGADPAMTGMRIFNPLPIGTADPTSQPGDIVGYY